MKKQMWLYPGDDYTDIVAPTAYNNYCRILNYEELVDTGKPIAMAEFSPSHEDNTGHFDNRIYIEKISENYTGIAFWISWHDWDNGDGTSTYMSIGRNDYASELMNDSRVITRDALGWKN